MDKELAGLRDLVSETLHPTKLSAFYLDEKYLIYCKLQVFTEKERIKKWMAGNLIHRRKHPETQYSINGFQSAIVWLSDVVYHYLYPNTPENVRLAAAYPMFEKVYQYVYQL